MSESKMERWESMSPAQALAVTILVPSLYILALAVAWWAPKNFGFGLDWAAGLGLGVGLFGLIFWVVAMVQLGRSLAVLPGSDRLVTSGVYRYVRHPIYLGIDVTLAGLFLAIGSTHGMIFLAVVILPLNFVRSRLEEKALHKKFGDVYLKYREGTWF